MKENPEENRHPSVTEQRNSPESLDELLKLKEQYQAQRKILEHARVDSRGQSESILQIFPEQEGSGIRGINEKAYLTPSFETVLRRLENGGERITQKVKQGFTRFLLVPFGLSSNVLISHQVTALREHHNRGELFSARTHAPLTLDMTFPTNQAYSIDGGDVFGSTLSLIQPDHEGRTKAELLASRPENAWRFVLAEDLPNVPRAGTGTTIGGRPQLEAGKTSTEYLAMLGAEAYHDEQGMTLEDYLMYAITHLTETNEVIDEYTDAPSYEGQASFLLGTYLNRIYATLAGFTNQRVQITEIEASYKNPRIGARSVVTF